MKKKTQLGIQSRDGRSLVGKDSLMERKLEQIQTLEGSHPEPLIGRSEFE